MRLTRWLGQVRESWLLRRERKILLARWERHVSRLPEDEQARERASMEAELAEGRARLER